MEKRYQISDFGTENSAGKISVTGFPTEFSTASRFVYATLLAAVLSLGWALRDDLSTESPKAVLESTSSPIGEHLRNKAPSGTQGRIETPRTRSLSSPATLPAVPVSSLIHELVSMGESGPMTEQDLHSIASALSDLVRMGAVAVRDIQDFLASRDDVNFTAETGMAFEYSSLRIALIDVLRRIGGFEAERVLAQLLGAEISVAELAAVADALDWIQPGFYTESILEEARYRLAILSVRAAPEQQTESGPLFRVFQNYGDGDTAAILYQAPYWFQDYAMIALANLPDEEGIAGLSQRARRELKGSRDRRSLHLLVQVAAARPQAEQALLSLVQSDRIPDSFWPSIADILMGDRQLQIRDPSLNPDKVGSLRGDNPYAIHTTVDRQVQVIYSVNYSAVLPAEQVSARLDLISRLMDATTNPAAIDALWDAFNILQSHYWMTSG